VCARLDQNNWDTCFVVGDRRVVLDAEKARRRLGD
jgi:hypothetical protein